MSTSATLVYTATPVPPVSQARLNTAMAAVKLDTPAVLQAVGCTLVSDTTANSGPNVTRTLVFGLPFPGNQQFNGNNPLPANSTVRQWFVVSTTGATASIGALIFDNGSGTGTAVVVPAVVGMQITTVSALTGGGVSFLANRLYTWSGLAWVDGGPSTIGRSSFQDNFPPGSDQTRPFSNLYTHALGAQLGSVITASPIVIA